MSKPWFKARPKLLETIRADLRARYPDLRLVEDGDGVLALGSFPIVHDSRILDRYQIQIAFPRDYPKELPTVREVGGRIPWVLARHVIPSSGNACLFVGEDWLLTVGPEPSFLEFLDGPVRNFFIGQSLVEAGKPWPFGERSHDKMGILETYGEWFGTLDEPTIVCYLDCLSREGLKGHWDCPCGSGKRLRQCHLEHLQELRGRMPQWLARQARQRLRFLEVLEAKLALERPA